MTEVYPGTIVRADKDGFKRLPWYESDTAYGPTGGIRLPDGTVARARLKKKRGYATVPQTEHKKRTPSQRAEWLAQQFVKHLDAKAALLGRPITADDLTDEEYQAFGAEFWKRGEPVTVETMKGIAAIYLDAVRQGASRDARWTPTGKGFDRPQPEQWRTRSA